MRAGPYYQSLILHNNAGPLGTAASLHAALAIPNVTLLEAPWANRDAETDVCWPYPEIVDGYALPLKGPGLGIEARFTSGVTRNWRHPNPFCPRCRAHICVGTLNAPDGSVRDF